jgi:aminomuconate-semialdehyde/2-hydroxymuconate-6-semialdehyde dehydrogenase
VPYLLYPTILEGAPYLCKMQILNYINGALQAPVNNNWLDNPEPATGKVYSQIPDSDFDDVQMAVTAAKEAFPAWSALSRAERSDLLRKLSDLILKNLDTLAAAESRDNGKPLWLAKRVDIPRAAENFRFFSNAVLQWHDEAHHMDGHFINYTTHQPIGVVTCISPWNLPLYLFSWKVAPALAAGCCVVAKPSEVTPMSAFLLSQLCIEAGFPPGVFNIVHGTGPKAGDAMINHRDIKAISFTGGTKTGAYIASKAAPLFKKLSLELGGKNANIIFADCDWDKMMKTTLRSSFENQGQICLCGSRILVERSVYERFKNEFVEKVKTLKVGDPKDDHSRMGAIVSKQHFEKILSCIELAKEEGGNILCGGEAVSVPGECQEGWFIAPTVIEGLTQNCRTNQEEIFGPVVTIQPFDTEEEAISYANATEYGLAGSLWTQDISRAHRVANKVESGILWVNCWLIRDLRTPFGGMKQSGVGREGGMHALEFFTETKNVCVSL